MKRKIVLSLIVAFIMCFSSLCFVGCGRPDAEELTVTTNGSIACARYTRDVYDKERDGDDEYDYLGALEQKKIEAMKVITNIEYKDFACFNGTYYVRKKGKDEDKVPVTPFGTVENNTYITPTEYAELGWFAQGKYEERYLSAYEFFLFRGGTVSGFNISQAPGTYKLTLEYEGATKTLDYTIT